MASAAQSLDNPTMLLLTSRTMARLSGRVSRSMKSMRCSVPFSKTRRSAAVMAGTARDESLCFDGDRHRHQLDTRAEARLRAGERQGDGDEQSGHRRAHRGIVSGFAAGGPPAVS